MRNSPTQFALHLKNPERGSSLIEYALLCALIAVVSIVAVKQLSLTIKSSIKNSADAIDGAGVVETY